MNNIRFYKVNYFNLQLVTLTRKIILHWNEHIVFDYFITNIVMVFDDTVTMTFIVYYVAILQFLLLKTEKLFKTVAIATLKFHL